MAELARDSAAMSVVALLAHYSFDGGGLTIEQLIDQWLRLHSVQWVRLALIEALYQGRYKAISVTQILAFWQRRDRPLYRFDPEFERLICNRLPKRPLTEGQQRLNTPASLTDTDTHAHAAPQASSKRPKTNVRPFPSPQVTSELSKAISSAANQKDKQMHPQPLSSNLPAKRLEKAISSPSLRADQTNSAPSSIAQPTWSELGKYSIHRFTPKIDASSFQSKLSALAQRLRHENYTG